MNLHLSLTPLISLLAGVLILFMPRLLNLIVAVYLIAVGLVGLLGVGTVAQGGVAESVHSIHRIQEAFDDVL